MHIQPYLIHSAKCKTFRDHRNAKEIHYNRKNTWNESTFCGCLANKRFVERAKPQIRIEGKSASAQLKWRCPFNTEASVVFFLVWGFLTASLSAAANFKFTTLLKTLWTIGRRFLLSTKNVIPFFFYFGKLCATPNNVSTQSISKIFLNTNCYPKSNMAILVNIKQHPT